MMSRPASSCSRIASRVASSWARARNSGATRHSSRARTRGGKRPARRARSISHSGWGKLPTNVVGNNPSSAMQPPYAALPSAGATEVPRVEPLPAVALEHRDADVAAGIEVQRLLGRSERVEEGEPGVAGHDLVV